MGLSGATREGVNQGETLRLTIQYQDQAGNYVDPSTTPTITIINSQNTTILSANSTSGVGRLDTGLFYYDYMVPNNAVLGMWQDLWSVGVNGIQFNKILNFVVNEQASPITAMAGQELDPKLSADAVQNVLLLMKTLRLRLASDGVRRKRDQFGRYILDANGNFINEPCNVFSTDELYSFIRASLAEFNSIPHFTYFTFDDKLFVETFQHELTEGAFILAMATQGLREKGREFQMTDDGLSYQPPQIADFLKSYMSDYMTSYRERLKFIKCQFKPGPKGFGTIYSLAGGGISPAYVRLRHLRARQII